MAPAPGNGWPAAGSVVATGRRRDRSSAYRLAGRRARLAPGRGADRIAAAPAGVLGAGIVNRPERIGPGFAESQAAGLAQLASFGTVSRNGIPLAPPALSAPPALPARHR